MTVSAQTPINRSTGNGVTTVFPYTFKIVSTADIEVSVADVVKTLGVDYTVSGAGDDAGGNVTMTVAPASGAGVVRRRSMALVRSTDYQDQGELPASTLDADIDATVLMIQQVDEQIGRALTLPAGVTGVSAELPTPEAGTFFGWNDTADALINKDISTLGAVDAATLVYKTSATGSATLPVGTTAEQDGGQGSIRFNSTLTRFEGHNGTSYGSLGGGATGGGADTVFQVNGRTVNTAYEIPANSGASVVGPLTINAPLTFGANARLVVL